MKNAIVYETEDIRAILAERHGVELKNVVRSQYSYTVILDRIADEKGETEVV